MAEAYLAIKGLLIPNGPGKVPSVSRFFPGQLVEFDGDEPIDIPLLVKSGAVILYDESNREHYELRLKLAGNTIKEVEKRAAGPLKKRKSAISSMAPQKKKG